MEKLNLKPSRPGLLVRSPSSGQPLPEGGATVPSNAYWRRRLRDGDVVVVESKSAVSKPSAMSETKVRRPKASD